MRSLFFPANPTTCDPVNPQNIELRNLRERIAEVYRARQTEVERWLQGVENKVPSYGERLPPFIIATLESLNQISSFLAQYDQLDRLRASYQAGRMRYRPDNRRFTEVEADRLKQEAAKAELQAAARGFLGNQYRGPGEIPGHAIKALRERLAEQRKTNLAGLYKFLDRCESQLPAAGKSFQDILFQEARNQAPPLPLEEPPPMPSDADERAPVMESLDL